MPLLLITYEAINSYLQWVLVFKCYIIDYQYS